MYRSYTGKALLGLAILRCPNSSWPLMSRELEVTSSFPATCRL